jgi:hypothetical protein
MKSENMPSTFENWAGVFAAPRSEFFQGRTADWGEARRTGPSLAPSVEPLFTQSNARVLLGHAADGSLRFVALPTAIYPAPTQTSEFGLGPGMYHHFDVAMYAGDLGYSIALEGRDDEIVLSDPERDNVTWYADAFLPLTQTDEGPLEIALLSVAPVAPDAAHAALAPAPLPGPPGAIYLLHLKNRGGGPLRGKIRLRAGDLLVGHYEDARPEMRGLKRPVVDLRQNILILTRPEGSVGVHLHDGRWLALEAPFMAERAFELAPGAEAVFETHVALGRSHSEVVEAVFALHLSPALDWVTRTVTFWRSRLGALEVDAVGAGIEARLSREVYLRSVFDNFNCLQTDAQGNLIAHWQGAPSHGYGTLWGIDVEPTAVSIVHACPELARQALLYFMDRSRAPKGPPDHSTPILLAPLVIARQWMQVTGDVAFLEAHPEVMAALERIMEHLRSLESKSAALYASRYSSDGVVGRRFDYGTNVKAWYAFDSMAYLLRQLGRSAEAEAYAQKACAIQSDIRRTMTAEGPFGAQVSGGTNLDEDPGAFYLSEGHLYYDGEDTSSMLAPVYGVCDFDDPAWVNYHRFARSLWHAGYDPEMDTLYWHPAEPAVFDGTAYFSRLAGSVTPTEMREAMETLRALAVDDVTGSTFWWPHGLEYKRSLTRCSQGQGAWAWQYLQQWLGLKVDAPSRTLTFAPRGLPTRICWPDFRSGLNRFGVEWEETASGATLTVVNGNPSDWTIQAGFRQPGAGVLGGLEWQSRTLEPGETVAFRSSTAVPADEPGMDRATLGRLEAQALADAEGVIFRRFGPALLWGHWNPDSYWRWDVMPLALRFLLGNHTDHDWREASVTLEIPDGWRAQGRAARHWTPDDRLETGIIRLNLGEVPRGGRTVAPFWIRAPFDFDLKIRWDDPKRPFHAPSQPGDGLEVYARRIEQAHTATFVARLAATTADGHAIERRLEVPVKIIPER